MSHIAENATKRHHKGVAIVRDEDDDKPLSELLVKHGKGTGRHGERKGTHDKPDSGRNHNKRRRMSTRGSDKENDVDNEKLEGANVDSCENMKSSKRRKTPRSGVQNDEVTPQSKQVHKGIRGSVSHTKQLSKRGKDKGGNRSTKPKVSRKKEPSNRNDGDVRQTALRSSLNGIRTLINDLPLLDEHKELMEKTPFWPIFDAVLTKKLTSELCRKSDLIAIKMINAYDKATDGFKLGPETYKIERADVANIFGIQDGTEKVVLQQGSRDAITMVSKGLVTEKRLSSSTIKAVIKKYATRSEEEYIPVVVSLLCAYLLHSVFFPTGTTVRWVCLERVEDLDQINKYDWCGAILDELMTSIRKRHKEPWKVSGCVLILMYWLCEHTNLVTPVNPDEPLGIVKWRTTDLLKELLTSSLGELQPDKVPTNHQYRSEAPLCSTPVDGGSMDGFIPLGDETDFDEADGLVGFTLLPDTVRDCVSGRVPPVGCFQEILVSDKAKDNGGGIPSSPEDDQKIRLIRELEARIARMTEQMKQNEDIYLNAIAKKDEEIAKKDAEIDRLNETVLQLVSNKSPIQDDVMETVVHAVTQNARQPKGERHQNSLITRMKTRSRKDTKKDDYVYENKRKGGTNEDDRNQVVEVCNPKTSASMELTKPLKIVRLNTNPVYRNLSSDGKRKIQTMWDKAYNSTTIWTGTITGCTIRVEDIRCLIVDSALGGNVIDAYTEFLLMEQKDRTDNIQAVRTQPDNHTDEGTQPENDTVFVFACAFLPMLGSKFGEDLTRVLENMTSLTKQYRYLMFPIHFGYHWTLLVLDKEEGSWLFFNPMQVRSGVDQHLNAAEKLKNQVESYGKSTGGGLLTTQDCRPIEPVDGCPQQAPESLDCGVIMCYVVRQYYRGEKIAAKLSKGECAKMRADMVQSFLGGEEDSWVTVD